MKLYKVTRTDEIDLDSFDSMVVAANSDHEASLMHPNQNVATHDTYTWKQTENRWIHHYQNAVREGTNYDDSWTDPATVKVQFIGKTEQYKVPTVILASFNAG